MRGRRRSAVVLAVLGFVVAGCGGLSRGELDEEIQARGGGLGSDLAVETLDVLGEELGDDLVLRSFTMTPGLANVEVRVPGTDDDIDSYRYGTSGLYGTGELSGPEPVPGVGDGAALRRTLFRAERVAFDRLDRVVDEAVATADLEDGYARSLRISRDGPRTIITVDVGSVRDSAQVRFRADGTPVREGAG